MTCPVCGGKTRVMDSRSDCEGVYRRRKCKECGYALYTSEIETDGEELKEIEREEKRERRRYRGD